MSSTMVPVRCAGCGKPFAVRLGTYNTRLKWGRPWFYCARRCPKLLKKQHEAIFRRPNT